MKRQVVCWLVAIGCLCSAGLAESARRPHHSDRDRAASGPRYVVSWQHVKGQCYSKPYHKISQQCQNRVNFWHGIFCRVTWSDGNVTDLHGQVDQVDAYGRAYCTRATRPAHFNCVSRCDYTNGRLITLRRP